MTTLSPTGHIPLNEETLRKMNKGERAFWDDFLAGTMAAMREAEEQGQSKPYSLSPELWAKFKMAVTVYAGDKYCQINQIRNIFQVETPVLH